MSDNSAVKEIRLTPDGNGLFDISFENGDLAYDGGLYTPTVLSIFTNARARADDPLPPFTESREGWVGDHTLPDDDSFGSRRWLNNRGILTDDLVAAESHYGTEALQHLVEDGVVAAARFDAWRVRGGERRNTLHGKAILIRNDGSSEIHKFDNFWEWMNDHADGN